MSPSSPSAAGAVAPASAEEINARRARWAAEGEERLSHLMEGGVVPRDTMAKMSGIEFFSAISAGRLPSPAMGRLMGFWAIEFEYGRFVFQGTPGQQHYNPIGMVHGGYAATLLDSALGCAIHTTLPAGRGFTTLELKVNYLRGLSDSTGPVRAEGKIIQVGAQIASSEGRITDAAGRLYAFATTTCLVFPIS
jgi:uncharacterized protein (TIGR00369 family)